MWGLRGVRVPPHFLEWGVQYPPLFRHAWHNFWCKVLNLGLTSCSERRYKQLFPFPNIAENAPFCTENFNNFLRPAARTMRPAGRLFLYPPTFQMKVTPLGMPEHRESLWLSKCNLQCAAWTLLRMKYFTRLALLFHHLTMATVLINDFCRLIPKIRDWNAANPGIRDWRKRSGSVDPGIAITVCHGATRGVANSVHQSALTIALKLGLEKQ